MMISLGSHDALLLGTLPELRAIAHAIRGLVEGTRWQQQCETDNAQPELTRLDGLIVRTTTGPTRVQPVKGWLHVCGSIETLQAFASYFDFPDDHVEGAHTHFEWWDGNESLAPDSFPLVIGVR